MDLFTNDWCQFSFFDKLLFIISSGSMILSTGILWVMLGPFSFHYTIATLLRIFIIVLMFTLCGNNTNIIFFITCSILLILFESNWNIFYCMYALFQVLYAYFTLFIHTYLLSKYNADRDRDLELEEEDFL